jgi:membrane protease YdiL (CAAX protease family)
MTVTAPGPGWFTDPWARAELRWWDGSAWTPTVASGGVSRWDGPPPDRPPDRPLRPDGTLPFSAVGIAAAGLFAGLVLSVLFGVVAILVTGGVSDSTVVTVCGLIGLWTGLVGSCVLASRQLGTRSLRRDLGVGWVWMDTLRGVWASFVGRMATIVVAIPLVSAGFTSSNTKIISDHQRSPAALVAIGLAVVVGAPIVEELFFRGLLLRSLASRLPYGWAVLAQAIVFGFAHADPTAGWKTIALVTITATFGVTQGLFARRWSLGPLMVSHALFNLLPVLLIAFK